MTDQMPTPGGNGEVVAGRYELITLIGRGGHGLVWRARDRQSGSEVALKMLTDVAAKDPGQVERLKREQQAAVALAGTNAVSVIDLCQSASGKLCLVMELLEGRDLEERLEELELRGERIPIHELMAALEPIVSTLERAHQAGIVHRDLKPANIFLTPKGVRLLDFGLARLRSALPLTAAGTIVGSPSYIAPEAWKGRSEGLDQRVDVYSLGVLVFRALTAHLPFEGRTLQEKFQLATSAERPSLHRLRPDLPAEIDEWVQQVLAIDPNMRFNSVRGAWNALLGSLGLGGASGELVSHEDLAAVRTSASPLSREPPPPPSSHHEDSVSHAAAVGIRRGLGMAIRRAKNALERWTRGPRPWEEVEPSGGFSPAPPPVASAPPAPKQEHSFAREWLAGSDYQKPAVVISPVLAVVGTKGQPEPLPEPHPEVASAERLHTQRLREPSEVIPADIASGALEASTEAEPAAPEPRGKKRGTKSKTKTDAEKPAKAKAKKQKSKSKSRGRKKKK